MMLALSLSLLALLAVGLLRPEWLSKESREAASVRVRRNAGGMVAQARGRLSAFGSPFQKDRELPGHFRQWVAHAALAKRTALYKGLPADAAAFTDWVDTLTDRELAQFVGELAAACRTMGFEPDWLADSKIGGALRQAAEEAVGLYGLAAWKARDTLPLATYKAWQAAPHKKENRAFAQRLYVKLVDAGLASVPAGLLLATERERRSHVAQAIETAAAQHSAAMTALLKETVDELAAARAEKASQADAPPRGRPTPRLVEIPA